MTVIAADGLYKRDVFSMWHSTRTTTTCVLIHSAGFPDPFAVATISGEQTRTTGVIKKTLNPYWNESFDMYVASLLTKEQGRLTTRQESDRRKYSRGSNL